MSGRKSRRSRPQGLLGGSPIRQFWNRFLEKNEESSEGTYKGNPSDSWGGWPNSHTDLKATRILKENAKRIKYSLPQQFKKGRGGGKLKRGPPRKIQPSRKKMLKTYNFRKRMPNTREEKRPGSLEQEKGGEGRSGRGRVSPSGAKIQACHRKTNILT